jgi:hypothetical protein
MGLDINADAEAYSAEIAKRAASIYDTYFKARFVREIFDKSDQWTFELNENQLSELENVPEFSRVLESLKEQIRGQGWTMEWFPQYGSYGKFYFSR